MAGKKGKDGLTKLQRLFVQEYLVDLNSKDAVIRAGYSPMNAAKKGYCLLQEPKIHAAIKKAMDARAKRTEITQDRVLKEIAKLAFANMLDYMTVTDDGTAYVDLSEMTRDQAAAIQELNVETYIEPGKRGKAVKKIKFKLADKKGNLEMCCRHLGMFNDKLDINMPTVKVVDLTGEGEK